MKLIIAFLFLATAIASATPFLETEYQFLFTKFVDQHSKQYDDAPEFFKRFNIFKANMDTIAKHNSNPKRTFDMAMNKFGDMSNDEFRSLHNHYRAGLRKIAAPTTGHVIGAAPASVDWRTKKVVTGVKNQEQCGSCWAFSSTGSIESAHAIKTGVLISLSEQDLVDCSSSYGNQGCSGGEMQAAFQFVQANGGLCTEADYPYKAADGTCQTGCKKAFTISGFNNCIANNETDLQLAVVRQPISIAVDASGSSWQFYSGGVITSDCGTNLDHGVLVVGYGTDSGVNYWTVKNSWGDSWGESGYIRIQRGTGTTDPGLCGIAMDGTYPIA